MTDDKLDGHEPEGNWDGEVMRCECGWRPENHQGPYGDYRDHAMDLLMQDQNGETL